MMNYDEEFGTVVSMCNGDLEYPQWKFSVERLDEREDILSLWRHLDPSDLSGSSHFILCNSTVAFEVDFLSRHEISKPYSAENMPPGWKDWAVHEGGSLLVYNRGKFRERILTADMFLALPKYRFQSLADDVRDVAIDCSISTRESLLKVLKRKSIGYSFNMFMYHNGEMRICLVYSALEGVRYEHPHLFRSASEQLELRSP